jgi:hypothetical protein
MLAWCGSQVFSLTVNPQKRRHQEAGPDKRVDGTVSEAH